MKLKRVQNWLKEIVQWLEEAKPTIMCFLVILATLLLGFFTWKSEPSIRTSGYFLQLIGMIFAIRGLLALRTHFGQPLLRVLIANWLNRFPKLKKDVIIGVGSGDLAMVGMKARAEVWSPDDPTKPTDDRISAIVKNLDRIKDELRRHYEQIDELAEDHKKHKEETDKHSKEIKSELRSELEALHTGDFVISLVGLVWLSVGITLSTLSQEIYLWVN